MSVLKPEHEWLGHVQPTGLVVSTLVLDELSLLPAQQGQLDTAQFAELLDEDGERLLPDPWAIFRDVLKWPESMIVGLASDDAVPVELCHSLADHETLLEPTWGLKGPRGEGWQLLVRIEDHGIDPDRRGALPGWEATPHQRFERLLRETGIGTGILITQRTIGGLEQAELRLITAPRGETSGWISWPLRDLGTVAGRPMLGGLKLLLDSASLFTNAPAARLPSLLSESRERQAEVSTKLAGQVLAALYELLRGFDAADGEQVRALAASNPHHLYEGLLAVLMRLVFILYAEDRDLMPSRREGGGQALYDQGYSVRALFARLENDYALHPDTMDERRGAWGQLLALFRLIDRGHPSGFMQARGGKLFDERVFPFLMGKRNSDDPDCVPPVSDGCIYRILQSLMVVNGERLSYRTLDVEQIGSVYETVMGFTAQAATGRSIAIKAGKNNKVPVYIDLDALLAVKAKDREKEIKEASGRGQFPAAVKRELKDADSVETLEAALSHIADERGSPRAAAVPAGTPILQPTDERRRTGSHYTPRSLTEPIVRQALEPAFERMGEEATPEDVLSLKVCDPACGSGAFLVEATRQVGARLLEAWEVHSALKPPIPADEDDELHARRLVAQRCIYGVDRNPMATDLAKLSLWLATLARDHEFSFLDHALKSGDSLVGLSKAQLSGGSWEGAPVRNTLIGQAIAERVEKLAAHREAIRNAPDDVARAIQESRHEIAEREAERVRLIGNAIIAAFFKHAKPKPRMDEVRYVTAMAGTSNWWDGLKNIAVSLEAGEHPLRPFHWEIEFPEVFARDNPGFDAIVGNPPFLGGRRLSAEEGTIYGDWLAQLFQDSSKNADLSAFFFRRSYSLIREGGAFGLLATKTIAQGDTRETGLLPILSNRGTIFNATKRLPWPGEAAVIVSVVHIMRGEAPRATLDGQHVERISAYLVDGEMDASPAVLKENAGKSFQGSILLGLGFTFDDVNAGKGRASTLAEMERLIAKDSRNGVVIKPYMGGDENNNSPTHSHRRFAIDFYDRPLERMDVGESWHKLSEEVQRLQLRKGVVAYDFPGEVARDWPDLVEIVARLVKPDRDNQTRDALRERWWQYADKRPGLVSALADAHYAMAITQTSPHLAVSLLPVDLIYDQKLIVIPIRVLSEFASVQTSVHELWARFLSGTLGDTLSYTPTDSFETFPLPPGYDSAPALEAAGESYHAHRAAMMIATDKGMTKTYNRFHDPADQAADIVELRSLHALMDDAVLRAYGWADLADRCHPGDEQAGIPTGPDAPRHLTEDDEDDHKYQKRLFWPAPFRDELLARLLKENEKRAAAEREEA